MRLKVQTTPNLAEVSPAHQEALSAGDEHYRLWTRNVQDHLKDKSEEEIRKYLAEHSYPFGVCFEHWIGDFNLGTGIRTANGLGASRVYYIGSKKWDKRAAVGVHNYTEVQWIPTVDDFKKLALSFTIVGVDNVPGSVDIQNYVWPEKPLMVFGEEGTGLTPGIQALCKDIVHIDMVGSVRSFNCGVASGMAMYDFVSKFRKSKTPF